MIRVSAGTAGVLGLARVPMDVAPTTAYLMVGGRCAVNCSFCAQARESLADEQSLSRVTWPEYPLGDVCARMRRAELHGELVRCCLQVTASRDYVAHTLEVVHTIRASTSLPLDVAILPASLGQVEELVAAGVDHIGFGLDAASERVFRRVKGAHWQRMLSLVEGTAGRFPGHAAIHLIVGLGETEQETVHRALWARDLGVKVGLFAFTPLRGTAMAEASPPSLGQYRRMQTALWLISEHGAGYGHFGFGDFESRPGSLVEIAFPDWLRLLADGRAFETSGCPGCNRPFYNERPGGPMYNFARTLSQVEIQEAISALGFGGG